MPFVVYKETAIPAEDMPDMLSSVRDLYEHLERWAGGESGPAAQHARLMQKHLQTMIAGFYYYRAAMAMRQALARVADEDLRDELEDQVDNKVHAAIGFAEAPHGGSKAENEFASRIPQFLEAYFHGQNPGQQQSVSQAEVDAMLAAAEDEEEQEEGDGFPLGEEEDEEDDLIVVEESTR